MIAKVLLLRSHKSVVCVPFSPYNRAQRIQAQEMIEKIVMPYRGCQARVSLFYHLQDSGAAKGLRLRCGLLGPAIHYTQVAPPGRVWFYC